MGSQTTVLTPAVMNKMLELFNHRIITVERDGYGEQSFEVHYKLESDELDNNLIHIDSFNKTADILINIKDNQVVVRNTVFDVPITSTFISSYDVLLYTYHLLCILSNSDKNNAMFVLTVLPTIFTILLKVYEELPENTDPDLATACKTILTHTQDICFDHNAIIISRKKF